MIRRTLAALALLLLWPTLALAQDAVPPSPLPRVVMETSAGRIVIEVNDRQAPITGGNFLKYVDEHRFDGTSFYRAVRAAPDLGLVQGGTNNDPARTLPPHRPCESRVVVPSMFWRLVKMIGSVAVPSANSCEPRLTSR